MVAEDKDYGIVLYPLGRRFQILEPWWTWAILPIMVSRPKRASCLLATQLEELVILLKKAVDSNGETAHKPRFRNERHGPQLIHPVGRGVHATGKTGPDWEFPGT